MGQHDVEKGAAPGSIGLVPKPRAQVVHQPVPPQAPEAEANAASASQAKAKAGQEPLLLGEDEDGALDLASFSFAEAMAPIIQTGTIPDCAVFSEITKQA